MRWFDEVTAGIQYAPIRIPVSEEPVEISPSWAAWNGNHIEYVFDGYDWDTIQGWKTPGETAVWRLDVQSPGVYRVVLTYGCRLVDQGGVVELHCGSIEPLRHTIRPTATADQFESVEIGAMELSPGEQELSASVIECPGRELMRLNRVKLVRESP